MNHPLSSSGPKNAKGKALQLDQVLVGAKYIVDSNMSPNSDSSIVLPAVSTRVKVWCVKKGFGYPESMTKAQKPYLFSVVLFLSVLCVLCGENLVAVFFPRPCTPEL